MSTSLKDIGFLKRAVRELIDAHVAHSWKGGKHPDEWPDIDAKLKAAQTRYTRALQRLEVPK